VQAVDVAAHRNTFQYTATHYMNLASNMYISYPTVGADGTHCNTLQHIAIHCNTLQYNATGRAVDGAGVDAGPDARTHNVQLRSQGLGNSDEKVTASSRVP